MKIMDPVGSPDECEQKCTPHDLKHRNDESQNNPSLLNGEPSSSSHSNTRNTEEPHSELDLLLPESCLQPSTTSTDEEQTSVLAPAMPEESTCSMVLQILVPFLLAGFGTVMASMLLDIVQHWHVFQKVKEIFILVPALLGLKGNLEMTLASRLSTAVNVGKIDSTREKWNLIIGNLALKQVQATVLGFLAALAATLLGWVLDENLSISSTALLCCSSVVTAFMASLLQGIIMVGVIVGSKKAGFNPDNIAAPIAASFGDLITLGLLAVISELFFYCNKIHPSITYVVCIFFLGLTPIWVIISLRHPESRKLLYCGWEPIITAMVISSMGGLILDKTISDPNLMGVVVYSPVINGVGGNLAAIQSSRIATYLHFHCSLGELPEGAKCCYCPLYTLYEKGYNSRTARVLLLFVIPGHMIFFYSIYLIHGGNSTFPLAIFMTLYLFAAFTQVFLLLCIADWMVHCLWRFGRDPDSFSIPYITALGDLLGTGLLALCFHLLLVINNKGSELGD